MSSDKKAPALIKMLQKSQDSLEKMRVGCMDFLTKSQNGGPPEVQRIRQHLWGVVRELDSLLDSIHVPHALDLDKDDDRTAQALYAFVVWRYFTPHPTDDPCDVCFPGFTPEEAQLEVYHQFGRWFVTWIKLEEDMSRSENNTRELLVITREGDGRIIFAEV